MPSSDLIVSPLSAATLTRRGWLLAAVAIAATPAWDALAGTARPRILFVCEAGTVKSPMARELFGRRARDRGIAVDAFSRGLHLADHVSAGLRQRLLVDRIDTMAEAPQTLTAADWQSALLVVAFNPLPASVDHGDVIDWTDLGSMNDDYDHSLADLNGRIERLIDMLEARGLSQ
jgi:protein-tyrosine-phosphatase